jgi:hypothetical protein
MGEQNAYDILVAKPERKTALRTLKCTWEDNIKMHVTDI